MIFQPIKLKTYMDNLTNKEPDIKDSTVQDSASKEQKKKESRPVIGAKA